MIGDSFLSFGNVLSAPAAPDLTSPPGWHVQQGLTWQMTFTDPDQVEHTAQATVSLGTVLGYYTVKCYATVQATYTG